MVKLACVFPGQGSQYVGMGTELADIYPEVRQIFAQATEALEFDLTNLCFNGPEEELKQTKWTQPAILTTSYAMYRILREKGLQPKVVAGHSLGEYTALVAAGVINFTDAVRLVHIRGKLMDEAVPEGKGTMAAVLGMESSTLKKVLMENNFGGVVQAANFNCPGQIVISGEKDAVAKAGDELSKNGGKVIPLVVSGPFHSALMKPAAEKFNEILNKITFHEPKFPIISNAWAQEVGDTDKIKTALLEQLYSSVRWEESIQLMINTGVTHFLELGPKKVLSGLIKKISNEVTIYNVEDIKSLEKTLAFLKEV